MVRQGEALPLSPGDLRAGLGQNQAPPLTSVLTPLPEMPLLNTMQTLHCLESNIKISS